MLFYDIIKDFRQTISKPEKLRLWFPLKCKFESLHDKQTHFWHSKSFENRRKF